MATEEFKKFTKKFMKVTKEDEKIFDEPIQNLRNLFFFIAGNQNIFTEKEFDKLLPISVMITELNNSLLEIQNTYRDMFLESGTLL